MPSDIDSQADKNTLLFLMASVSPLVADSLERESYRITCDTDEASIDHILGDAIRNLFKDVNSVGIILNVDPTDYIDDLPELRMLLELVQLLLPNTLYASLKTDTRLRTMVEHVVGGTLSDHETVIETYLSQLGGLDSTPALRPHLTDFIDGMYPLIKQTPLFSDYLKNIIDLLHQERPSVISDDERHSLYRDVLRKRIGLLSDAINSFDDYPEYQSLVTLQNFIIRDFIAPDNFINYAYLLLENESTLPPEIHDGYQTKWYHYRVSHPWCFDYHQVRKQSISRSHQIAILCFAFAMNDSVGGYSVWVNELLKKYPDLDGINQIISNLFSE